MPSPRARCRHERRALGACCIGGLVIIVDLATQRVMQRTATPDDPAARRRRQIINFVLFLMLGVVVVRETGLFYLGALAGVFASVLDCDRGAHGRRSWRRRPAPPVNVEDAFRRTILGSGCSSPAPSGGV